MSNLSEKQKEFLIKVFIVTACICVIETLFLGDDIHNNFCGIVMMVLGFGLALICILVIVPYIANFLEEPAKPGYRIKKIKIKSSSYNGFIKKLEKMLLNDKYKDLGVVVDDDYCEIRCFKRKQASTMTRIYMVMYYKQGEISKKFRENFPDYLQEKIYEIIPPVARFNGFSVIHILYVDKRNEFFDDLASWPIEQLVHKTHLQVLVSKEDKMVYITPQENPELHNVYMRLRNTFIKYLDNQIDVSKKVSNKKN